MPAFGLIPERLVTIRSYSSADSAAADCRLLLEAGIDAYIRTYRWEDTGEVRVPESQVREALTLLPAVDVVSPEARETCQWCGSHEARTFAPFTGVVALLGVALILWAIYRREYDGAGMALTATLIVLFMMKTIAGRLVCVNCKRDWRRAPLPAPDPDSEG